MSDQEVQGWDLFVHGRRHRVEIAGSFSRTVTWHVDGRLVAAEKSSEDTVRLEPGDRVDRHGRSTDAAAGEEPDPGAIRVTFTGLGRTRRVTWYQADGAASATSRALLGTGGIDLDPEPGSPAALREERIRRHPRRHAALAVAGGVGKVVVPLLLGLLAVRLVVAIPWPDWNLPAIPWPDVDLPSIPWPHVDLPDWQVPDWVRWLADKVKYVWPVVLAAALARAEMRRRRHQDALKAQMAAEALSDDGGTDPRPDRSRTPGPVPGGDDAGTTSPDDVPGGRET